MRRRLERLLTTPYAVLLRALGVLAATFTIIGLVPRWTHHLGNTLSVDTEVWFAWPPWRTQWNIPALMSCAVLALAGLTWAHAAPRLGATWARVAGRVLAGGLLFMSLDELASIHEGLESLTGVRWLKLYLPVIAALGVAAGLVCLALWRRGAGLPLATILAAGSLWVGAQVLELFEWSGPGGTRIAGYDLMMRIEETSELTGSGLFVLAAAALWQCPVRGRGAGRTRGRSGSAPTSGTISA